MKISQKQLDSLIEIYNKKYGVVISQEDAYELTFWMMNLIKSIYD